jgi:regulator of sigma E protease
MHLVNTLVAFAVALGTLIIVHEFGHYLVARWCGVKVLRFSVGFGQALVSRRLGRDRTEWVLAAFPLGGYVKMLDEREGEVAPDERHRAFNRQPVYKRFAIVLAGPLANFVLAIVVYWCLFMHGVPGSRPVIDAPPPQTPAATSGFHGGETIVKVAGQPVRTWEEVRLALLKQAVARHNVEVETRTDEGTLEVHHLDLSGLGPDRVTSDFLDAVGLQPLKAGLKAVVETVIPGGAAERSHSRCERCADRELGRVGENDSREPRRTSESHRQAQLRRAAHLACDTRRRTGKRDDHRQDRRWTFHRGALSNRQRVVAGRQENLGHVGIHARDVGSHGDR